jgi:hypothetical protein
MGMGGVTVPQLPQCTCKTLLHIVLAAHWSANHPGPHGCASRGSGNAASHVALATPRDCSAPQGAPVDALRVRDDEAHLLCKLGEAAAGVARGGDQDLRSTQSAGGCMLGRPPQPGTEGSRPAGPGSEAGHAAAPRVEEGAGQQGGG